MSDEQQPGYGVSVMFKAGPGYEAPWFGIRAEGVEALGAEIQSIEEDPALLKAMATIATTFQGFYEPAANTAAPASSGGQAAPAAPTAEHGFCEKCKTPLVFQSGTSQKTGKDWKAYGCPQKGYGHTKNFIN